MGIDRLVMFLTDSTSTWFFPFFFSVLLLIRGIDIKEVLFFPAMKPLEVAQPAAGTGQHALGPSGQV